MLVQEKQGARAVAVVAAVVVAMAQTMVVQVVVVVPGEPGAVAVMAQVETAGLLSGSSFSVLF